MIKYFTFGPATLSNTWVLQMIVTRLILIFFNWSIFRRNLFGELNGTTVNARTILTNPMKASDLTKMVPMFWQVVATNIFPQVSHHSELSSYVICTLCKIVTGRMINLPSLILNHIWMCQSQKTSSLCETHRPYSFNLPRYRM